MGYSADKNKGASITDKVGSVVDNVFNRVLRSWKVEELENRVEDGHLNSARTYAQKSGIDPEYVDQYAEQVFNNRLENGYSDAASYVLRSDLDKEKAREKAIDRIEEVLETESNSNNRDRYIGEVMDNFNIREEEISNIDNVEMHFYLIGETAEEELAEEILDKRSRSEIEKRKRNRSGYLAEPKYGFADPEIIRKEIESMAPEKYPDRFQTEIYEWNDGIASKDLYERFEIEWALTEELEEFIEDFQPNNSIRSADI